jgi:hypothetical protein
MHNETELQVEKDLEGVNDILEEYPELEDDAEMLDLKDILEHM